MAKTKSGKIIEQPQRNIGMELVRATEAAAQVAGRHLERGELDTANTAAIQAMKAVLDSIEMDGVVAIGEGNENEVEALFHGDEVGSGSGIALDVGLDVIEGNPSRSLHRPDALALAAAADRGSMWNPGPIQYVETLAVGAALRDRIDLTVDIRTNLKRISAALKCDMRELNVLVLDRPRHADLIKRINVCGARVKLHHGGFIAGVILAATPGTKVDVLISTGLANDAVLAAAAVKALGGAIEIRPDPQTPEETAAIRSELRHRAEAILDQNDLIKSKDVYFAATGITDGSLLKGVRFGREGTETESIVIREKTGTVRYIRGILQPEKLKRFSQISYDGEGG
jgi:fructose-1,6-bisphosphatase II